MRGHGAALATAILMLVIVGVASALPSNPELGRITADGPVALSSSKKGVALLQGTGIKPGDSVTGLITLSNKGDKPGRLALMLSGLNDRPGVYGGRLSSVLRLRIDDLTTGGAPVETSLVRSTPVTLGDLKGRQSRTYRVTATFPDSGLPAGAGLGDNSQQGSTVEVAMAWNLSEKDPVVPKPPARPVAPGVVAPVSPPLPEVAGRPKLVTLRVPAQRVIKPRKLNVFASCEVRCKLKFSAKIDNAPKPKKKGHKAKRRRVIMGKKVLKKANKWVTLKRIGKEKRYSLKLTKKALRKLKKQLHKKGRAGITITARMHSVAGNRVVRRRIVMRTYKNGFRGRPAKLR
jgi:hypothetical protein